MGNTSKRGFASMDNNKQRLIASKGGKAAHAKGTAHEWSSAEARAAGRKGGESRGTPNPEPRFVDNQNYSVLNDAGSGLRLNNEPRTNDYQPTQLPRNNPQTIGDKPLNERPAVQSEVSNGRY